MSDEWYYDRLHAKMVGYRLLVLANRFDCQDDFARRLHDQTIGGLEGAIMITRRITKLLRELAIHNDDGSDWRDWPLVGEIETEQKRLADYVVILLDELEIDHGTYEYHVNGGEWHNAFSVDCDGIEISYPTTVALTDDELGSLAPIINDIIWDTGITFNAARVVYD